VLLHFGVNGAMKIISASVQSVVIDDDTLWYTCNLVTGKQRVVPKAAWPTYLISLMVYRNFYPIDPPVGIETLDDIQNEEIIQIVQNRIGPFARHTMSV
jgi:hypothetical protein